ncbi:MAG: hypothetical protein ICV77_05905 [Cyanobacteria bacterium Co-bin8]|nr:hypothetical protein [Cyanobacteria bacterium Co-bin8]
MSSYTPVSCDLQDQLESLATLRQPCKLVYRDEAGEQHEAEDLIVDIYAANKADYLKLQNGTEIRLDRIESLNGDSANGGSAD